MIKSMTGYASESFLVESTKYIVEIKSINSKILDLKIRLPQFMKQHEFEFRKLISSRLLRGKIELNINQEINQESKKAHINSATVKAYIKELKEIKEDSKTDYLKIAMQLPDSYSSGLSFLNDKDIKSVKKIINAVINKLDNYRLNEGKETEKDILSKFSDCSRHSFTSSRNIFNSISKDVFPASSNFTSNSANLDVVKRDAWAVLCL